MTKPLWSSPNQFGIPKPFWTDQNCFGHLEGQGISGRHRQICPLFCFLSYVYRKVASSNTSRLEAHAGFFRLLMRGIFDPCDKKLPLTRNMVNMIFFPEP